MSCIHSFIHSFHQSSPSTHYVSSLEGERNERKCPCPHGIVYISRMTLDNKIINNPNGWHVRWEGVLWRTEQEGQGARTWSRVRTGNR